MITLTIKNIHTSEILSALTIEDNLLTLDMVLDLFNKHTSDHIDDVVGLGLNQDTTLHGISQGNIVPDNEIIVDGNNLHLHPVFTVLASASDFIAKESLRNESNKAKTGLIDRTNLFLTYPTARMKEKLDESIKHVLDCKTNFVEADRRYKAYNMFGSKI